MFSLTSAVITAQNVLLHVHDHDDHSHEHAEHAEHAVVAPVESGHSHGHVEGESLFTETWNLITDPAHALTEIFYDSLFNLIIIPIVIFLFKKFREPKLRAAIHKEIDAEHGIQHKECNSETTPKTMSDQH